MTIIFSGTIQQNESIVYQGVIPFFIQLLKSKVSDVAERV